MVTSKALKSQRSDRGDYGFARVRDKAFDAVLELWRRRQSEGRKLTDLASVLHRDGAAVCRNLSGPGNWTLRTFGELVEAMDGEVEISVHALEDPLPTRSNSPSLLSRPAAPGSSPWREPCRPSSRAPSRSCPCRRPRRDLPELVTKNPLKGCGLEGVSDRAERKTLLYTLFSSFLRTCQERLRS